MSNLYCICAEGDSWTSGVANVAWPYATRVNWGDQTAAVRSSWTGYKSSDKIMQVPAISGSSISMLTSRAGAVDALLPPSKSNVVSPRPRKYILTILIGTNPSSPNGTTQASLVATYIAARRAAGWDKIILGTLCSRGDGIIADFETYRQDYNALVKDATWRANNGVDAIFDIGSDANIGAAGACNSTTYYSADKIHLNSTGYAIANGIYTTAVDALIATL